MADSTDREKRASYLDGYIAGLEALLDYDRDAKQYLEGIADAVREYAEGDILDLRAHKENMKLERDVFSTIRQLEENGEEE